MNKIASLFVVLLISGFVVVKMNCTSSDESQDWLDGQLIDEKLENYRNFKQVLEDSLEGLGERNVSLREAQKSVCNAASRFSPTYLKLLPFCEQGMSMEERGARNLVGHMRTLAEINPKLAPRIRELEIELAEIATIEK